MRTIESYSKIDDNPRRTRNPQKGVQRGRRYTEENLRKIIFYPLNKFQGIKFFDDFSPLKNSPQSKDQDSVVQLQYFHETSMKQMHKNSKIW